MFRLTFNVLALAAIVNYLSNEGVFDKLNPLVPTVVYDRGCSPSEMVWSGDIKKCHAYVILKSGEAKFVQTKKPQKNFEKF